MAMRVIDRLEVVDVHDEKGKLFARRRRRLQQRRKMPRHIAPVEQAGQLVGDRHLDRQRKVLAKLVGIALALELRADARGQLVAVNGPHHIVVHAKLECTHEALGVALFDDRKNGRVACGFKRFQL